MQPTLTHKFDMPRLEDRELADAEEVLLESSDGKQLAVRESAPLVLARFSVPMR